MFATWSPLLLIIAKKSSRLSSVCGHALVTYSRPLPYVQGPMCSFSSSGLHCSLTLKSPNMYNGSLLVHLSMSPSNVS